MKARGYAFAGAGAGLAVALIAYLAFRADSGVVPSDHAGEAVLGEEREVPARTDGAPVVDAKGAKATAPFQVEVIRVTTVFGPTNGRWREVVP